MSPDALAGHLKLASRVRFRFEDCFQRNRPRRRKARCVINQWPRRIRRVLPDARIGACDSLSSEGSTWPSNGPTAHVATQIFALCSYGAILAEWSVIPKLNLKSN